MFHKRRKRELYPELVSWFHRWIFRFVQSWIQDNASSFVDDGQLGILTLHLLTDCRHGEITPEIFWSRRWPCDVTKQPARWDRLARPKYKEIRGSTNGRENLTFDRKPAAETPKYLREWAKDGKGFAFRTYSAGKTHRFFCCKYGGFEVHLFFEDFFLWSWGRWFPLFVIFEFLVVAQH